MKPSQNSQLLSISTAVPDHVLEQRIVAKIVTDMFSARFSDFSKLQRAFVNCGIARRRAARDIDWYVHPRNWSDRNAVYLEVATSLFINAARKAMAHAKLTADDIGSIVTISSTGIAAPSLEARSAKELGLRRDVSRVPVFGLGCAGGVSGLSIASRLANADPDKAVLLVIVELCTLAARIDQTTKTNMIALALFGDGAAAAVVKAGQNEGAFIGRILRKKARNYDRFDMRL